MYLLYLRIKLRPANCFLTYGNGKIFITSYNNNNQTNLLSEKIFKKLVVFVYFGSITWLIFHYQVNLLVFSPRLFLRNEQFVRINKNSNAKLSDTCLMLMYLKKNLLCSPRVVISAVFYWPGFFSQKVFTTINMQNT